MRRLRGIGFSLAIVALTVGIIAGVATAVQHIPKPEKRIEWLYREDSIIVQLRTAGGDSMVYTSDRERLPAFTLYGDGTLIISEEATEDCGAADDPCSARLLESHLSDDSIQDLIDLIDGTGFFNFEYRQPVPPVQGAPTTYLYASSKLAANAVRAEALGWEGQDDAEWREFRKLATIRDRIVDLEHAVATASPFVPEEGLLLVTPRVATDLIGVPEWRYPEVALPTNAREDDVTQVRLSAEQIASMALERPNETTCWTQVQYIGRLYDVCYRPALPFEENFPEFDNG